jgi:membrane associated rhomboid family serine protease
MAAMATFLASGIIHEYVWYLLFYTSIHQDDVHVPPFGKQLLFFGWNGILLVMEYAVRWEKLVSAIPKPIVTLLVVLMALPVGHLFTGDMLKGGYFSSLQLALPILTWEQT